jgi:hypothetical protein
MRNVLTDRHANKTQEEGLSVLTASFIKTRNVTALHDHPIDKQNGYGHPSTAGRVTVLGGQQNSMVLKETWYFLHSLTQVPT